jgi:hypothetical protein
MHKIQVHLPHFPGVIPDLPTYFSLLLFLRKLVKALRYKPKVAGSIPDGVIGILKVAGSIPDGVIGIFH